MTDDKPTGRIEEPAPSADATAVGEPTVVESHPVPASAATPMAPAQDADPAGPAHRADAPIDGADDGENEAPEAGARPGAVPVSSSREASEVGSDADSGTVDTTVVPPLLPGAGRGSGPAAVSAGTAPSAESFAAAKADATSHGEEAAPAPAESFAAAKADATSRVDGPTRDEQDAPEATGLREPRAEERRQPAFAAPAVAAAPIPAPTEPVVETPAAPVAPPAAPRPVYLDSPLPPKRKGNRGFGILMSVLATIVYALVWAAVAALVIAVGSTTDAFGNSLGNFLVAPAFWVPVLVFAIGMIVLSLIVNRGGWAWWLIGGFLVAVLVYFGYLGGALLTVANRLTPADVSPFLGRIWLTPHAIAAGVIAREVSIWFGLAASARGRKVKARNAEARAAFDREAEERRSESERARAGYAE